MLKLIYRFHRFFIIIFKFFELKLMLFFIIFLLLIFYKKPLFIILRKFICPNHTNTSILRFIFIHIFTEFFFIYNVLFSLALNWFNNIIRNTKPVVSIFHFFFFFTSRLFFKLHFFQIRVKN